ncbi:MAG: hypothetical protein ACI9OJ_004470 [Myxococcota bacterium]|jgi:hypothetical protein
MRCYNTIVLTAFVLAGCSASQESTSASAEVLAIDVHAMPDKGPPIIDVPVDISGDDPDGSADDMFDRADIEIPDMFDDVASDVSEKDVLADALSIDAPWPDEPVDPCEGIVCDDQNPCTEDECASGACQATAVDGQCNDGDWCTVADGCVAGECLGIVMECDDGNECTSDTCLNSGVCDYAPLSDTACEDGQLCLGPDKCEAGACIGGEGPKCADATPCTQEGCNERTGECEYLLVFGPCDDGEPCTLTGLCAGGVCTKGPILDCDDSNPCTADECDPSHPSGCAQTLSTGASCDDGNPCTESEACEEGLCVGTAIDCDDGDACTEVEFCLGGECQTGIDVSCDDADPCTTDTCDPTSGCVFEALDDGLGCELDAACEPGVCSAGECEVSGELCDDGNVCTVDVCTDGGCDFPFVKCDHPAQGCAAAKCKPAAGGCTPVPVANACEDGILCSVNTCSVEVGCVHEYPEGCCSNRPFEAQFDTLALEDAWEASSAFQGVGWQIRHASESWSGTGSLYYGNQITDGYDTAGLPNQGSVTTPTFELPAGQNNLVVRFWVFHDVEPGSNEDRLQLTMQPWNHLLWELPVGTPARDWHRITVELKSYGGYSGALRFAFDTVSAVANSGVGIYIDDLAILGCN